MRPALVSGPPNRKKPYNKHLISLVFSVRTVNYGPSFFPLTYGPSDIKTHYKPTETFQYTHFTSCHPPGVKRGFIKGEATRLLLRTNSSQTTFEECLSNFKLRLKARGYPNNFIERSLTGVRFEDRRLALQQRKKTQTKILPFVTTYHPAVRGLKEILMNNWVVIQNQPLLKSIYTKPPIISYKRGKSLKDTLVRAKI